MVREIIGAWKLKSAMAAAVGQSPGPFLGQAPAGLMSFAKNGMVNMVIVPQEDPHEFGSNFTCGPYETTDVEITASGAHVFDFSYTIQAASDPDLVDEVKKRSCEISSDGKTLTLSARDYYVPGAGKLDVKLVWDKL